jgi:PilZ domain
MQPDPLSEELNERRDAPRIDLDGAYSMRLDPGDGREPITCLLMDFSVTGVRLKLPDDIELPRDVHILIGELSHNARIVWRKDGVIGVDLIDEHHNIIY